MSGAQDQTGYQVRQQYDPAKLSWTGFASAGLFGTAVPIIPDPDGGSVLISVALLGGKASGDPGSLGDATFTALEGASGDVAVSLVHASYNEPIQVGHEGATVTLALDGAASPDFNGDGNVTFSDFILLAQSYGTQKGDAAYHPKYDLDGNDEVGFPDFIRYAQSYGQPVTKPGSGTALAKSAGPGAGTDGGMVLRLVSGAVEAPDQVQVAIGLTGTAHISGFGLTVRYDASALAFSRALTGHRSLFTGEHEAALLKVSDGVVHLADAMASEAVWAGDVALATLVFDAVQGGGDGWIEIAEAMVADARGEVEPVADVRLDAAKPRPTSYRLSANLPNPFNPATQIEYQLAEAGNASVVVYNVLGQRVCVLADRYHAAGVYHVGWDGTDDAGRPASSGVYLFRLVSRGFSRTNRMLLLR